MPIWAAPAVKWVGERFLHVVIYGAIILGMGFFLYSAFLKPTTSQKTTNNAEKIDQYTYSPQIKVGFGGCANLKAEKLKSDKK